MKRWLLVACLALPAGFSAGQPASPPYNAETTFQKLYPAYPFIRIASSAVPAGVQVRRDLVYTRRGDLALALDLYLPAAGAAPAPLVVLVHGGGWRSGDRAEFVPLAVRLAARGYAAAAVSYRLSGQARYPAAVDDVTDALRWLYKHAAAIGADPARIAIAGGSAGGQIAALVGMREPALVRAVVNIDGLSDFTTPEALRHEDDPSKKPSAAGAWFGGRYAERRELWHAASPINHVGKGSAPVLFITSSVPRFSSGREAMTARLAAHGIVAETVNLPATPHAFWLFDPWLAPTVDAMTDFLDRVLDRQDLRHGCGFHPPGKPENTALLDDQCRASASLIT